GLAGIDQVRAEARDTLGDQFLALLDEGPAESLNQTINTQPAMVTAGYAAYRAWRALGGPAPELAAGHSLGEYTALTAAGALTFADCLPLVHFRAQAMQEAVPQGQGAMAAVLNLDDEHVVAACAEAGGAAIRGAEQRRRENRARSCAHQGCAGAPGGIAGALGRDDPEFRARGRDACPRMRARPRACRHDPAHRAAGAIADAARSSLAR